VVRGITSRSRSHRCEAWDLQADSRQKRLPNREYSAGSVLVEDGFHIHQPSNPGSEETEIYILFVIAPEPALDQIVTEPKACKM